jgi:DNA gyrase/topoisomerase IV subunit B
LSKIEVLEEIEHIRLRPGMYTVTENPAHLLTEVIDNSLDELANGHADSISIDINSLSNNVVVTDNGRGLPKHQVTLPDGKTGDSVIVACTKLFSGGKFDLSNYETSIGLHGVGLVVLNALSNFLRIEIRDKEDKDLTFSYDFKDSQIINQTKLKNSEDWSTRVSFQINPKYFKSQIIPTQDIKTRLYLVAAKYPDSNIKLNNEKIPNLEFNTFCKGVLGIEKDVEVDTNSVSYKSEGKSIEVFFTYEEDSKLTPTIMGDVNLNLCNGTYLSTLTTLFYKVVNEVVNDERLTKSDVLNQLRLYSSLTISNPEFQGQQKDKCTSDVGILVNKLYNDLKFTLNTFSFKERFTKIIESKEADKAIKKIQKRGKRLSGNNPIKDSLKIPGDILYLVEGDSAGGTLKTIRNRATEAVLPLTGKIANTINKDINQALSSDKMKYLLEAIGVGQNKYRYDKIKILADGDPDGLHIGVLACIAIWKFAPDVINNGKLSVILPPLYGARKKGKTFIPIYKLEDTDTYKNQGYDIKRFKGLGEMQKEELKEVIYTDPQEYIVKPPTGEKEIEAVTQCLVNTELKRIICSDSRFGLHRIFDNIQNNNNKNIN